MISIVSLSDWNMFLHPGTHAEDRHFPNHRVCVLDMYRLNFTDTAYATVLMLLVFPPGSIPLGLTLLPRPIAATRFYRSLSSFTDTRQTYETVSCVRCWYRRDVALIGIPCTRIPSPPRSAEHMTARKAVNFSPTGHRSKDGSNGQDIELSSLS